MREMLGKIHDKMATDEELPVSYCKIKMKSLNTYWERILCAQEEISGEKVPRDV